MNVSVLITKEIVMSGTIIAAGLTFLFKLFTGRRNTKLNKKRKLSLMNFRLFFNHSNIEKFNLIKKNVTNTNYIVIEDKYDKLKDFVGKSEEQFNEKIEKKPDLIFFKLLKNYSTILSGKNTNIPIKKKKCKTKDHMMGFTIKIT